ncbi:hypothetical protein [Limnothrix redekei]|uniref:Uncharacterized protein n=1 Tax=Limnothrix redekei LRLZ20PSL1 TaxID=3112953 RepID=A0ABW7CE99_9CYAN
MPPRRLVELAEAIVQGINRGDQPRRSIQGINPGDRPRRSGEAIG